MAKISFVMPTHNRESLIGESIQSIIDQNEQDWELIIVDDHSDAEDKTEEVVGSFNDARIKFCRLPDKKGSGVACARNYANIMATSSILAVCDSDDLSLPHRANLILESYEKIGWDIFYGDYTPFLEDGAVKPTKQVPPYSLEQLKLSNIIPHGSSAYTKRLAMHYPYNSTLNIGEDYDLFTRMAEDGRKFYHCDEVIFKYRVHDASLTSGQGFEEVEADIKKMRGWL